MTTNWTHAFEVVKILQEAGYRAYIVGGAVRDHLLGIACKDIDVATDALPENVQELFPKTFATGIAHGTVTVLHGDAIEVTTFRVESEYIDKRRPSEVRFVRELKDDLSRRDFTINALAMGIDGEIIDYYGGKEDLQNKLIRAVGQPKERFEEDALRILRGIRLAGQLGFSIETQTRQAMTEASHLLAWIAKERIKQEVSRIWTMVDPEISLRELKHPHFDEFLPGVFTILPERHTPFESTAEGWAWFHYFQPDTYEFPYSNDEKRLNKEVVALMKRVSSEGWTYQSVFDSSESAVRVCWEISQSKPFATKQHLLRWLQDAPIRFPKDLALTGHDLMQLKQRNSGPWIKKTNERMADEILAGNILNTRDALKKWVLEHVE